MLSRFLACLALAFLIYLLLIQHWFNPVIKPMLRNSLKSQVKIENVTHLSTRSDCWRIMNSKVTPKDKRTEYDEKRCEDYPDESLYTSG